MLKFYFLEFIKNDNDIKNYTIHAKTMHTEVINTTNILEVMKLRNAEIFPILISFSKEKIDIICHFTLGILNFLTKKMSNTKIVIGLTDKEDIVDVKDLIREYLLKEKMPKLDKPF